MKTKEERSPEIMNAIRTVLVNDWYPIGIKEIGPVSGIFLIVVPLFFAAAPLALSATGMATPPAVPPPPATVRVTETEETFPVVDEGGGNPRTMRLRQVRMENDYLRVDFLPQLGGRVRSVFDKSADRELFLVRPIEWPPTRYTAYGSQLGGHEINFPCFHHGNNYMDQWNWAIRREPGGSASVTVGWTAPEHRQRVVARWELHPGDAVLRCRTRYINLNARPMGFAPWSNFFFGYADDLQYIIPASRVAPHGFNDSTLDLWPWPWPEWDEDSLCFWRNIPRQYNSVFAVGVEENFNGVYYTRSDHGMVRLFDRTRLPGIKMYCVPPSPDRTPKPTDYTEIWTSPVLSHEDMLWWEAYGIREYDEAFYGVHGIGGYRFANESGALNLTRHDETVELAIRVTRPLPGAVVTLSSVDGDWLRDAVDLAPERPWRAVVRRAPGRLPLDARVIDAQGRCILHYEQRPDPAPRRIPQFEGSPIWRASPYHQALKAEQYHALWRGPTGGYGGHGEPGARAFRALLQDAPERVEYRLGLARSLLTDVQLRQAGQPRVGTPEETAARAVRSLAEAAETLEDLSATEPRAALLLGKIRLRQGDPGAATRLFRAAGDDPVAALALARLAAAETDLKAALRHSEAALRAFPGHPSVVHLHAANLIRSGALEEAKKRLNGLTAIDPVDALTFHLLALADPKRAEHWTAITRTLVQQTDPPRDLEADLGEMGLTKEALAKAPVDTVGTEPDPP